MLAKIVSSNVLYANMFAIKDLGVGRLYLISVQNMKR